MSFRGKVWTGIVVGTLVLLVLSRLMMPLLVLVLLLLVADHFREEYRIKQLRKRNMYK